MLGHIFFYLKGKMAFNLKAITSVGQWSLGTDATSCFIVGLIHCTVSWSSFFPSRIYIMHRDFIPTHRLDLSSYKPP